MRLRAARGARGRALLAGGLLAGLACSTSPAHPAYLTAARIAVEGNGEWHGEMRFDLLAFVLNDTSARIGNEPMEEILAGPAEALDAQLTGARERLRRGFHVVTEAGIDEALSVTFPDAMRVQKWRDEMRPVLPVVIPVQITGQLPRGAQTVAFRFPSVLEQVILTVERPGEEPWAEAVEARKGSTPLAVRLTAGAPSSPAATKAVGRGPTEVETRATQGAKRRDRWGKEIWWLAAGAFALAGAGFWDNRRRKRSKHAV